MTVQKQKTKEPYIKALKYWTDLSIPGSFSSSLYFKKGLRARGKSTKNIDKQLKHRIEYQKLKNPRKRFPKRAYPAFFFGDRWEADLIDWGRRGKRAGKPSRRFILLVIDVFSRKLFSSCLPNKKMTTVTRAFEGIIADLKPPYEKPVKLQTDQGGEFKKAFTDRISQLGIQHSYAEGFLKARYIERAARNFKKVLLGQVLTEGKPKSDSEWFDLVKKVTENLNARYHKTLQMTPDEVSTKWLEVHRRLVEAEKKQPTFREMLENEGPKERRDKGTTFRVGDSVLAVKRRIRIGDKESDLAFRTMGEREKKSGKKGKAKRRPYWGELPKVKVFKIAEIMKDREPYLFRLKAKNNRVAKPLYYAPELRAVRNGI